jgi:hypothetical protein
MEHKMLFNGRYSWASCSCQLWACHHRHEEAKEAHLLHIAHETEHPTPLNVRQQALSAGSRSR